MGLNKIIYHTFKYGSLQVQTEHWSFTEVLTGEEEGLRNLAIFVPSDKIKSWTEAIVKEKIYTIPLLRKWMNIILISSFHQAIQICLISVTVLFTKSYRVLNRLNSSDEKLNRSFKRV